jgi:hypothetical protein|tara:strand:- start:2104 stop:2436 length:333 start_codon:yes stop_codon:yes gene_type:complete
MEQKLNILLLTLSSGEELIANVKDHIEEINGVQQKVCYNLVYPFTIRSTGQIDVNQLGVSYNPWKKFSSDNAFLIGFDGIINMCTPLPSIVEGYKKAVDEYIKSYVEVMQ